MPLTHMTYAFVNPLRWIFGDPLCVAAFSNRLSSEALETVIDETCCANLVFDNAVIASMVASYVQPRGDDHWKVSVLGTEGAMEILPTEMDAGSLRVYRGNEVEELNFPASRDAFVVQAETFLDALEGNNNCRNLPDAAIGDVVVAEAIVTSARKKQVITL